MSASLLGSADVLKNVYFDYNYPLGSYSGDPDDKENFFKMSNYCVYIGDRIIVTNKVNNVILVTNYTLLCKS